MATSILGAVDTFAFGRIPSGWIPCDGRSLQIHEYNDLYTVIETIYGGDGERTFNVPNISGRVVIGTGQGPGFANYYLGQAAGAETVSLVATNVPPHTHSATAVLPVSNGTDNDVPTDRYPGVSPAPANIYASTPSQDTGGDKIMAAVSGVTDVNPGGAPINIQNPILAVNYCICAVGIRVPRA